MNTNTILLVIAILLLFFLLNRPDPETKTTIHYHYDTTLVSIPVNVTPPQVSLPQPIPQTVDTAAILAKYFTVHFYKDTIRDSGLVAVISDSIGFNRLLHRSFDYRILRPSAVISTTTIEKKLRFSAGAFTVFDSAASFGVMGGVNVKGWEVVGGRNLTDRKYLIGVKKEF